MVVYYPKETLLEAEAAVSAQTCRDDQTMERMWRFADQNYAEGIVEDQITVEHLAILERGRMYW